MSFFKQNKLLFIGLSVSIAMICVLVFVFFKTLFYLDSEKHGKLLTSELIDYLSDDKNDAVYFTHNILAKNVKYPIHDFDYFPQNFRPVQDIKSAKDNIVCNAMTDVHSFSAFTANVRCYFGNQYIHYHFTKNFDRLYWLILIAGLGLFATYKLIRFILYVEMLKEQNLNKTIELAKEKIVLEAGAKLVHDLKKGAMAQINNLYQELGNDLDEEMIQPDFMDRLKAKLNEHFKHIRFLNKYMSLLMLNFKRQKEANWILLDIEKLTEYFQTVFSVSSLKKQGRCKESGKVLFVFYPTDSTAFLEFSEDFLNFWVPEMSFFRILKNVSENFNTYGDGSLSIEIFTSPQTNQVFIKSKNAVRKDVENADSTQLGLIIIRQLVIDNFGNNSKISVEQHDNNYTLTLVFPLLKESEDINHAPLPTPV